MTHGRQKPCIIWMCKTSLRWNVYGSISRRLQNCYYVRWCTEWLTFSTAGNNRFVALGKTPSRVSWIRIPSSVRVRLCPDWCIIVICDFFSEIHYMSKTRVLIFTASQLLICSRLMNFLYRQITNSLNTREGAFKSHLNLSQLQWENLWTKKNLWAKFP